MTETIPGAATDGGPSGHAYQGNGASGCDALLAGQIRCGAGREQHPEAELTDAEKLAALQAYLKALKPIEEALRARVTEDMGIRRVERVGAYLDGMKIAAVGYTKGRKSARVTDPAAALKWCLDKYPDEIVKAVNPAFLKALTDYAVKDGQIGDPGVDPRTGEVLDFIKVSQGSPYVSVTTTKEGVDRMEALAHGFAGMLEPPTRAGRSYDPDFADPLRPSYGSWQS